MATQKRKGINIKFFILIFVILFWAFLAVIVFVMANLISGYRSQTPSGSGLVINEEDVLTCDDVMIRFVGDAVCYDSRTQQAQISIMSVGRVNVSTVLVNIYGEDSMVMSDTPINLLYGESETIKVDYDLDLNGFIRVAEIIPNFVKDGSLERCESSKVIRRSAILSCK